MEPSIQSNRSATDATAAADELRMIAAEIQEYMGKWVIRSRRVIGHACDPMQGDKPLSTQMQKFEESQRKWETRRQKEMDEIADKAEELAAAWLKLESEQRQFLQMKEAWQHGTNQSRSPDPVEQPESSVEPDNGENNLTRISSDLGTTSVAVAPRAPQSTPQLAPRLPQGNTLTAVRPAGGDTRDAAIRQFELLRREVAAKHR